MPIPTCKKTPRGGKSIAKMILIISMDDSFSIMRSMKQLVESLSGADFRLMKFLLNFLSKI